MKKLTICLSGHICRENSANLHDFWQGFINIQNQIPNVEEINIVGHCWNPEYRDLVQYVYGSEFLLSEKQTSYTSEYMSLIKPIDKFEKGLIRAKSIWKKCSLQALIGISKSRSKAVSLLSNLDINDDDWVLVARWDQGCTGSESVNTIIVDPSLPKGYIYLSYYSEIDEGYADMWFLSNKKIAIKFESYSDFVLDSLVGKNDYFTALTQNGWPTAKKKKKENQYVSAIKIKVTSFILETVRKCINIRLPLSFGRKLMGLEQRINNYLNKPILSGENSLELYETDGVTFPNYQALNNHAILKYFFKEMKLREKTRFLDVRDFANSNNGIMINPIDYVYVIYSHSSFSDCWNMAIKQAQMNLSSSCKQIYIVSENSIQTQAAFSNMGTDVKLLCYDDEKVYSERLVQVMSLLEGQYDYVYFVHEDMPLINKIDSIYLNTLLHYLNNSNEFYIKLIDTTYVDSKEDHDTFPYLNKNIGGYSFSIQPSLVKISDYIPFLCGFSHSIYDMEIISTRSNFVFSAVKGDKKVGKYLLINDKFPHIATAISKGKWCTSEWGDSIYKLAEKYSIDIKVRGEC